MSAPQGWSISWTEAPSRYFWLGDDAETWWSGDDDAVWWSGEETVMRPWPGAALLDVRPYLIRIDLVGGAEQPSLDMLRTILDVETIEVKFNDVAVGTGGAVLDISGALRLVTNIQLTLEDDGGTAAKASWEGKNDSPGPRVWVRDAAGAPTTGTIDATITGARA
jgi:hypothetical protein